MSNSKNKKVLYANKNLLAQTKNKNCLPKFECMLIDAQVRQLKSNIYTTHNI